MKQLLFLGLVFVTSSVLLAQTPKWEKLEGCTYKADQWNDGDSFHVIHNGTEFIFRLYFVDTPEENERFLDRNADQAAYFAITPQQTLKLAEEAADFTRKTLSRGPFSVWTCHQDARGSSTLPREYAIIKIGSEDLAELLVKNGLARIYGKRITLPDGRDSKQYRDNLDKLEAEAKRKKLGGWPF